MSFISYVLACAAGRILDAVCHNIRKVTLEERRDKYWMGNVNKRIYSCRRCPRDRHQENAVIFQCHKDLKGVFSCKLSATCVSVIARCGRFCLGVKRLACRASDVDELEKKINNPSHGTHLKIDHITVHERWVTSQFCDLFLSLISFDLLKRGARAKRCSAQLSITAGSKRTQLQWLGCAH